LTIIEGKTAYPYITEFKKEQFKSFVLIKRRDIGNFYLSSYNEAINFYRYFNENLFKNPDLNLENIYWFLLLRKYLGEDKEEKKNEIYDFIKRCAVNIDYKLGFRFSPNSTKQPDIWSTYFALASFKLLGLLKEYLWSEGTDQNIREIMNFIMAHKKGNSFIHCLDENCEIDKKTSPTRTLYFVLESFILLGIDIRTSRDKFISYVGSIKKEPSLVYKLLCLKFLDLERDVNEKIIHYLLEFQKENGGFSFKKINGRINTTFWLVYALDNYYWLMDYNPVGIYSFISSTIKEILNVEANLSLIKMMELSKSVILLSTIWKKFIDEIERVIFKQLEQEEHYVDLYLITSKFGLIHGIDEVLSYINLNYTFTLRILDNKIEFNNFIRNLSNSENSIVSEIYNQLRQKNIISLSEIHKKYKRSLKLKEDIFPLIKELMNRNFFKGKIVKKRISKFYLYLDFFIEKVIVSDTEINLSQILNEKETLKDIKNDIYNMTLKLKNASRRIKEEIESYLIIDELDYAKERLKFILRNALMDADFLNENIENSFNLDLYYINIQNVLKSEISKWNNLYSVLSKRLSEIDSYLKEKIAEKEELRNLNRTLDQLDEKIFNYSESINKKIDEFKNFLRQFNESEYQDSRFAELITEFEKIRTNTFEFDKKIYEISQKIIAKDEFITEKRKKVIGNWVSINEELKEIFDYYLSGFNFFKENLNKLNSLKNDINEKLVRINKRAQEKVNENRFQEAFDLIKKDSDDLLNTIKDKIDNLQRIIKDEIKNRQKLYLLYRMLSEMSENLEEKIIGSIAEQVQSLKNKVIEERNKARIEDFDSYVSNEILKFKTELIDLKKNLDHTKNKKLKDVFRGFERLRNRFDETHKTYIKKLNDCKDIISNFDESNVTIVHWNNFYDYFTQELDIQQDESINGIITDRIFLLINENKTNNVNILDLKKDLNLKCKILMSRIKDLIEISKLNGKLYEDAKCLLVYTEDYYKNKELRNYIDNKLLKQHKETIGKVLALYDSSIRNRTLSVNMLELQNRLQDLNEVDKSIHSEFNKKINELKIQSENRVEYKETLDYFESIIANSTLAADQIANNLELFNNMQNSINHLYNDLQNDLTANYKKIMEEFKNPQEKSYLKIKESFNNKWSRLGDKLKLVQEKIEEELTIKFNHIKDSNKLIPEIREFSVKRKNIFLKDLNNKKEKIYDELIILKGEVFRENLINNINNQKIQISRMLGTLQTRVEDDIEIANHKIANSKIQKRAKDIDNQISHIVKDVKNLVKEFNKQSSGFETKNKYILEDFNRFINEFQYALTEKVKSLEQLVIKSYIDMTIKAVSNEYLTIGFLNHELKIKRQNIQDHIIFLISDGSLKGKYDPRLGIYYENPKILENLDEDELEVIKSMNLKMYLIIRRLKSFASMYGSILGLFASILAITYWFYIFSGNNPAVAAVPVSILLVIIIYFMFKRSKDKVT